MSVIDYRPTELDIHIESVDADTFSAAVDRAMLVSDLVDTMLSHGVDYSQHRCFLSADGLSGYAVTFEGDLQSVFSLVKGRGHLLIESANSNGAITLDCFDGYLPWFYAQHGWVEDRREANWAGPTQPDVVYMVHA